MELTKSELAQTIERIECILLLLKNVFPNLYGVDTQELSRTVESTAQILRIEQDKFKDEFYRLDKIDTLQKAKENTSREGY